MSNSKSKSDPSPPSDEPDQPDSMEQADTANGERPTHNNDGHRTGERQARENRDNESPA